MTFDDDDLWIGLDSALPTSTHRFLPQSFLVRIDEDLFVSREEHERLKLEGSFRDPTFRAITGAPHELVHDFQFRATRWGFFLSQLDWLAGRSLQAAFGDRAHLAALEPHFLDKQKPWPSFCEQLPHLYQFQRSRSARSLLFSKAGVGIDGGVIVELAWSIGRASDLCDHIFTPAVTRQHSLRCDLAGGAELARCIENIPVVSILELGAKAYEWVFCLEAVRHPDDERYRAYLHDTIVEFELAPKSQRKQAGVLLGKQLTEASLRLGAEFGLEGATLDELAVSAEVVLQDPDTLIEFWQQLLEIHRCYWVTASLTSYLSLMGPLPPFVADDPTEIPLDIVHPALRFSRLVRAVEEIGIFAGTRDSGEDVWDYARQLLGVSGLPLLPTQAPEVNSDISDCLQQMLAPADSQRPTGSGLDHLSYLAWNFSNQCIGRDVYAMPIAASCQRKAIIDLARLRAIGQGDPGCCGAIYYESDRGIHPFPSTLHPAFQDSRFGQDRLFGFTCWFMERLAFSQAHVEYARTRGKVDLRAFPKGFREQAADAIRATLPFG